MEKSDKKPMDIVIDFLRERDESFDLSDWNSDLIEARILDSLAFVEFLLVIEEITGSPVDLAKTDVQNLRTLSGINALITSTLEP